MTVQALLKMSPDELMEWYEKSFKDLQESEAKAVESGKYNSDSAYQWATTYEGHEEMFRDAVDLKFKLTIIKFLDSYIKYFNKHSSG